MEKEKNKNEKRKNPHRKKRKTYDKNTTEDG